jgi:quercetin dioxygenase-like cupin family protein
MMPFMKALFSKESAEAVDLNAIAGEPRGGIFSRTLVQTAAFRLILFALEEGEELAPHRTDRRAWIQVLAGEGDFLFEGISHVLSSGAFLHLPPQHLHAVRARTTLKFLLTLEQEAPGAV